MSKLAQKLFINISIVIFLIFTLSLLLTNYLLPKYYLYKTREKVNTVTAQIQSQSKEKFINNIQKMEENYNTTIVYTPITNKPEDLSRSLRGELLKKRVTLNRFWIGTEKLKQVEKDGKTGELYNQGKLKTQFFINLLSKEDMFIVVGVSMAQSEEIIKILNNFNFLIFSIAIVIVVILVWIQAKKITDPLKQLSTVTKDISSLNFKQTNIKTNDEIQDLAESINIMSNKLCQAHQNLTNRNENLKRVMGDITHELKTPIALIKAYSIGIKDGIDDGTYLDTVIKQTDNISNLIEKILNFSKIERNEFKKEQFNIVSQIYNVIELHEIEMKSKNVDVFFKYPRDKILIFGDKEKIEMVFKNFISNAIKYTTDHKIEIKLEESCEQLLFSIENRIESSTTTQIEKIWEPFFVLESSRNKNISGTGLGLAIVKSILDMHDFQYGVHTKENKIEFYVHMQKNLE
ncbi:MULTISPECIES: sensor histidine kinase [Bacillus cereus group]|uniref:histidine kinase n=1 Tax=Bacillus thuringiensis TaxID=1428 RepID=A0A9X7AMZ3_BACTU|nr:HAMP domain-containing sensor histidine kinase [Bacillus thuringiensis]MCQ6335056.1 HAMP domain-containing histidine kinase [Bacillus cereus]PFT45909.1 two-component sensor histidine kinase [Bacillus thuringiensis]